jgi:hypothetical protein
LRAARRRYRQSEEGRLDHRDRERERRRRRKIAALVASVGDQGIRLLATALSLLVPTGPYPSPSNPGRQEVCDDFPKTDDLRRCCCCGASSSQIYHVQQWRVWPARGEP